MFLKMTYISFTMRSQVSISYWNRDSIIKRNQTLLRLCPLFKKWPRRSQEIRIQRSNFINKEKRKGRQTIVQDARKSNKHDCFAHVTNGLIARQLISKSEKSKHKSKSPLDYISSSITSTTLFGQKQDFQIQK